MANESLVPQCSGSPVESVGPTADYYFDRAKKLAEQCAEAMRTGDIIRANELYDRGVNAMANHMWHARLAKVVGRDFSIAQTVTQP